MDPAGPPGWGTLRFRRFRGGTCPIFTQGHSRRPTLATRDKPIVSFAKLTPGMEMPDLLDVQLRAFQTLLQTEAAIQEREDVGLERVFNEIFPISDVNGNFSLEFVRYSLGEPKYDIEECMERDMTYAAPLKATLRLIV